MVGLGEQRGGESWEQRPGSPDTGRSGRGPQVQSILGHSPGESHLLCNLGLGGNGKKEGPMGASLDLSFSLPPLSSEPRLDQAVLLPRPPGGSSVPAG